MTDFGLKVSSPGTDVDTASIQQLVVDTNYPFPKCDLRKNPKNYGTLNVTVGSIPSSTTASSPLIIYQQPHGYNYVPEFITAWSYPVGTDPASILNSTFGIGDIDASLSSQPFYIAMLTDNVHFTIEGYAIAGSNPTNVQFSVRFYIFADDFSGT